MWDLLLVQFPKISLYEHMQGCKTELGHIKGCLFARNNLTKEVGERYTYALDGNKLAHLC